MNPFDPADQNVGIIIGVLIALGFVACIYAEIRDHVRLRRDLKRLRARQRWIYTPEAFRGPEPL